MAFAALGLIQPLLRAIVDSGYSTPTRIQQQAIPVILSGKDVMAAAQTGTGKTAAFALPLLQHLDRGAKVRPNHIRALVLTPTRELAMQVADALTVFSTYLPLKAKAVYGGVKINPQMMALRKGIDVLVATPGRLLDLYRQNAVQFDQLEVLVLDEADKMLDLGFLDDIRQTLDLLPKKRQNLLFSATLSSDINTLAATLLLRPVQIEATPRHSAPAAIKQYLYEVDKSKKPALLCHLLQNNDWQQVLVFVGTKKGADQLVKKLTGIGISAIAIHGDKSQGARIAALSDFASGSIRVLVATDIASRGLDINELSHVINVDLPKVAEDYIHRIGRTGRAGLGGVAISLVSADEVQLLSAIETLLRQLLVREVAAGYIPTHSVPLTRLKPPRPKKPKKDKKVSSPPSQGESERTQPADTSGQRGKNIHRKPRWQEKAGEKTTPQGTADERKQPGKTKKITAGTDGRKTSQKATPGRNRKK